jgi:hypothetical protein
MGTATMNKWKAVTRKVMIQQPTTALEVIIKGHAEKRCEKLRQPFLTQMKPRKWCTHSCKDIVQLTKICACYKQKKKKKREQVV